MCAERKRDEYLTKLKTKLMKGDDENEHSIKINEIVSKIRKFLKNDASFETNQEGMGMTNVLQGARTKSWTGSDFEASEDRKHNKIIIEESVIFHKEH